MKNFVNNITIYLGIIILFTTSLPVNAQLDSCDASVPYFNIDLTGAPDSVWTSPNLSRYGQCCGASNNENCISFELVLDPQTAGIQIDMIGADPKGSLFYDIDCEGNYPGGSLKCISGVGPHYITFCKPGSNKNIYVITSIPKPTFPETDTVRIGCSKNLKILGIEDTSIIWNSIFPGAIGDYNSYLSCSTCVEPQYSPITGAPAFVDYEVCGFPIADECGYVLTVCDTVRIYNFNTLNATITPNPATYCDFGAGSGVSLSATASGGDGNYSYTWFNSFGVQVGTGTSYFAQSQGTYTLELGDGLNSSTCASNYFSISVTEGDIPLVDAGENQMICASAPVTILNGNISFATGGIWTGGNGDFTPDSASLNVAYTPTTNEINAGEVNLILTSYGAGGGCPETSDTIKIIIPDSIKVALNDTSVLCNGGSTNISPTINGGTSPYTYFWSTGESSSSIIVGEGAYEVIVRDSIGCKSKDANSIFTPSPLSTTMISIDATTNGGTDGTATASPFGGTPGYTYSWSPSGQTTQTATNLAYGVHTVIITDTNGCTMIASVVVNEPRCASFSTSITHTNLLCYGKQNATAQVTATGGTIPYSYSWTNGDTTSSIDSLSFGTHTITVTDSNSCVDVQTINITQPTQITNVITHIDATIIGGNNGSATTNAFGGSLNYTYIWSNTDTSKTTDSLYAGIYSVEITDDSGCIFIDSVQINEPPCNDFIISLNKKDVTCGGLNDGEVSLIIANGTSPFNILWSDGQTETTADSLAANAYSVAVTDASNCTTFGNITITEPNQLNIGLAPTDMSCFEVEDGTVDATVTGGVFPYSFSWSNGKSSEDIAYLIDTTYELIVTDANGCKASNNTVVNEPTLLEATYTISNVTCNNGVDAIIDFIPTGGVLSYNFLWSTGETTEDVDSLSAGGYSVQLTDANGCRIIPPIVIGVTEPDSIKIDSFTIECPSPGSGVSLVNIISEGGNLNPYQISYNNGGTFNSPGIYSSNLPIDSIYSIIIKDSNSCTSHIADTILINSQVMIDSINFQKCFPSGTSAGLINVYSSGGEPTDYTISYNNGSSFAGVGDYNNNLPFNTSYIIIARDSLGCLSAPDTINLPDSLHIDATVASDYNGEDVSCYETNDGSISTSVTGGTENYSYLWSNSAVTDTLDNIGLGTYTVQVTDGFGCKDTAIVSITQPDSVAISTNIISNYNGENISCYGYSDGLVVSSAIGGTGAYNYLWSNSTTNDTLSNVGAGTYTLTISDINGCIDSAIISLSQPDSIGLTISNISNYNGRDVSCYGLSDGSAYVFATNGTGTYSYNWSNSSTNDTISNIGVGTYFVYVTDVNSCVDTANIIITQPDSLDLSLTVTSNYNGQNISCYDSLDGAVNSTLTGGTDGYSYSWSNGEVTPNLSEMGIGSYTLTIIDTNGCTTNETIILTQPDSLDITTSVLNDYNGFNVSCYNSLDGSALIVATGGTVEYTYLWSNNSVNDTLNNVGAGLYTVTVIDVNGCLDSASIVINQPDSMSITKALTNVSCDGGNDGAVDLSVIGGVPSYNYSWTGPASFTSTSEDLGSIAAGTYYVSITDSNGCVKSDINIIVDPSAISLDFDLTNILCHGDSTGDYNLIVNGGTLPYLYSWAGPPGFVFENGISEDQSNLIAGTYIVTVTDSNNCYTSLIGEITQPEPFLITKEITNVSCYGLSNASIILETTGGILPYNHNWSTGQNSESLDSITEGTYHLTLTDSNNCLITENIIITQPDSLIGVISSPLYFNGHNVTFYGVEDGSIDVEVNGGTLNYSYVWSNNETSEDLNNIGVGFYSVVVNDQQGCEIEMEIELTEPYDLAMPTGYSPNDDGSNDNFVVRGIEAYPNNNIVVFNRWGNIVYEQVNYQNEWDGLNNGGDRLPDATYFVILKINDGAIELTGYVDMRR